MAVVRYTYKGRKYPRNTGVGHIFAWHLKGSAGTPPHTHRRLYRNQYFYGASVVLWQNESNAPAPPTSVNRRTLGPRIGSRGFY